MKPKFLAPMLAIVVIATPASASVISARHKPNDYGWGSMQSCNVPSGLQVWTHKLAGGCQDPDGY